MVRLPMADGPLARPVVEEERPPAGPPRRILVVEDSADARESLRVLLEMDGHRVAVAEDGGRALEVARSFRPEVAVIDIGLPVLDGYEVARRLRRILGPGVHLIAMTGYGQAEDRRRAREAGFDAHLVKPVDPGVLARRLAEASRRRAPDPGGSTPRPTA